MAAQNYKNHIRLVAGYHYLGFTLLVALIIGSCINLFDACHKQDGLYSASLICLSSFVLLLVAYFARSFALKAQDRAIRAEENLRHFVLTGSLLDKRLRIGQIIALRFASDEEFVALAKKAADQSLSSKDIKMSITNWKEDNYRV
jgi:hypothetical protein